MNGSNFQLLQEATQNMATPEEDYGQEGDSAEESNPSVDIDEQDEAEAQVDAGQQHSVTQPASQIPSTSTPNHQANAELMKHLDTIPIEDRELQEALRQLQAGEHIPDKTPVIVSTGDGTTDTPSREVRRRAVYTREQKLAAVHFTNSTFRTAPDGTRRLISGPEAAQLLNCSWTVLGQWIKDADKIQSMDPGAQKQRWARRQSTKMSRRQRSPFRQDRYSRMRNDQQIGQYQVPNGTQSAATRDELRKMVMYQDPSNPRKAPPSSSQQWGQPPFNTPGVAYGAPTPAPRGAGASRLAPRGYAAPATGGWGFQGGSLVSYEIPWAPARRVVQQVCSTIDAASQCQGSDVQFTTVAGSKVTDSTLINCNVSSSDVGRNASVYQSTLIAAKIADDADIACSTIKSSIVRNATLTNCTVTNCRITGGRHFGKTFENKAIDGTEKEEPVVSNKRLRVAPPAPDVSSAPAAGPDASSTAAAAVEMDMADADGTTDEDEGQGEGEAD